MELGWRFLPAWRAVSVIPLLYAATAVSTFTIYRSPRLCRLQLEYFQQECIPQSDRPGASDLPILQRALGRQIKFLGGFRLRQSLRPPVFWPTQEQCDPDLTVVGL